MYKCGDSSECRCNGGCRVSGNCCMDYLWNVTDPTLVSPTKINQTMSKHVQTLLKVASKEQVCLPFFNQAELGFIDDFILIVSCLPNKTHGQNVECLFPFPVKYAVPVLGNDNNLYSNVHCARCNDVSSYKFLDMKIACQEKPRDSSDIKKIFSTGVCLLKPTIHDESYLKRCRSSYCDSTKATFCRLFVGYVKFYQIHYKNVFCADCLTLVKNVETRIPEVGNIPDPWSKTITLFSFDNSQQSCRKGYATDAFGRCVKKLVLCGDGYEIRNQQCVLKEKTVVTIKKKVLDSSFQNCLTLNPVQLLVYMTRENGYSTFPKEIQAKLNLSNSNWMSSYFERKTVLWRTTNVLVTNKNLNSLADYLSQKQDYRVQKVVFVTSKKTINTTLYGYDHTRTFKKRRLCASMTKVPAKGIVFLNSSCEKVMLSNHTSVSNMSMINLEMTIENGSIAESVYYCQKYHLYSGYFRQNINLRNYIIDKDHSLTFNLSGRQYTFAAHQYVPTLNGFQICWKETGTKPFEKYSWYSKTLKAKQYITVIGTSCSLLAYLVMFLAFYFLKDLRNTGGMYVLVLVILLFLTDIIFIINGQAESQEHFCKWLGILLHFFLILVCEWTAVVAVVLAIKFAGSSRATHRSTKSIVLSFFNSNSLWVHYHP